MSKYRRMFTPNCGTNLKHVFQTFDMLMCNIRQLAPQRKQTQRRRLGTKNTHNILNFCHYNVTRDFKINDICDWMSKNVIHILSLVETGIPIRHNKI